MPKDPEPPPPPDRRRPPAGAQIADAADEVRERGLDVVVRLRARRSPRRRRGTGPTRRGSCGPRRARRSRAGRPHRATRSAPRRARRPRRPAATATYIGAAPLRADPVAQRVGVDLAGELGARGRRRRGRAAAPPPRRSSASCARRAGANQASRRTRSRAPAPGSTPQRVSPRAPRAGARGPRSSFFSSRPWTTGISIRAGQPARLGLERLGQHRARTATARAGRRSRP